MSRKIDPGPWDNEDPLDQRRWDAARSRDTVLVCIAAWRSSPSLRSSWDGRRD